MPASSPRSTSRTILTVVAVLTCGAVALVVLGVAALWLLIASGGPIG